MWAQMVICKVKLDKVAKELQEKAPVKAWSSCTIAPTPAMATDNLLTKKKVRCLKKRLKKKSRKGKKRSRKCP